MGVEPVIDISKVNEERDREAGGGEGGTAAGGGLDGRGEDG